MSHPGTAFVRKLRGIAETTTTGPPTPDVRVTDVRWGPAGGLQIRALVTGGRPGPRVIGELRLRGGWSLSGFNLQRGSTTPEGTQILGTIPLSTLDALPVGLHDLSLTMLVGRHRHVARIQIDQDPSLPGRWNGLVVYRTRRGNLTLKRESKRSLVPAISTSSVDQRVIAEPLPHFVDDVSSGLRSSGALGACDPAFYFPTTTRARFDDLFPGMPVSMILDRTEQGWRLSALGRGRAAERFLRNVLINRARMVIEDGEQVHIISDVGHTADPRISSVLVQEKLIQLLERFRLFLDAGPAPEESGLIPAQWWDTKPNFGDLLGPMLIEHITGRSAINVRAFPSEDPGLFTVGSVAAHLQRPGAQIWGSGVIGALSQATVEDLAIRQPRGIHAVRGALTRAELQNKLGWDVPAIYGDPGLLLPRYYTPKPSPHTQGRIAVVPHYVHSHLIDGSLPDDVAVVDVHQGPEVVIDQITSARACISSSLHGLVVAQAYDVPWTWLRIDDAKLRGDSFKFEDFFTVLERAAVSELQVSTDDVPTQDWVRVADGARRPTPHFDAERLLSAFPAL